MKKFIESGWPAAITFTAVIYALGFARIPLDFFTDRDDAVISFSHAVNLVDYGFIGVSPSGERVEGYSTPLHFILYLIFYFLFKIDYAPYIHGQTIVFTTLIGFTLYWIFKGRIKGGDKAAFWGVVIAAIILSLNTRWLQWHGSGMENPLVTSSILGALYLIGRGLKTNTEAYVAGLLLFLVSISRVEGIYYALPMAFLYWLVREKVYTKHLPKVAIVWFGLLGMVFLVRYFYFGAWMPNTGVAQHISVTHNLQRLFTFDMGFIYTQFKHGNRLTLNNGAWALGLGVFFLVLLKRWKHYQFYLYGGALLFFLTYAHAYLFGATRLDVIRYGTHLAPICVVAAVFALFEILVLETLVKKVVLAVLFVPAVFALNKRWELPLENICCLTEGFRSLKVSFQEIAAEEEIIRPMLCNPDLGMMSYTKEFNFTDVAFLGNSLYAHVSFSSKLKCDYIFYFSQPDIMEMHMYWADINDDIVNDPRIDSLYELTKVFGNSKSTGKPYGIWKKKTMLKGSDSQERKYYEQIKQYITTENWTQLHAYSAGVIQSEKNLMLFLRPLYKFLPEIRQAGQFDILYNEIENAYPNRLYGYFINNAFDKNWVNKGLPEFIKFSKNPSDYSNVNL